MFKFFKRKTELDRLNEKYAQLRKDAFHLSKTNRKESDAKIAESEAIMDRINELVK